jgi:hypothetical protein
LQVGKTMRFDSAHLRTLPIGTGDGSDTLAGRPQIPGASPDNAEIGDTSPPDSLRYFHYPADKTEAVAQYIFKKMLQFSPSGECRPQNNNYTIRGVAEIGLQPVQGTSFDNSKLCAIQVSGFSGNTKVYRP